MTTKIIGIHEINGHDTPLGKEICELIARIFREHNYKAKYLNLENEFDCEVSFGIHAFLENGLYQISIQHDDTNTECSRSSMDLGNIEKWVRASIIYFKENNLL